MRIVILDRDHDQAERTRQWLVAEGHVCTIVDDASRLQAEAQEPDCCALALVASEFAPAAGAALRGLSPPVSVLLLVGNVNESEIVASMESGVDDYVFKPLRRVELLTRIRILLRRRYPGLHLAEPVRFGQYAFDVGTGCLSMCGLTVDVTRKEFELALLFFRHLGRPLSRAFIREAIWAHEAELPSRTLDTHVSRVRTKLKLRPENGFRLAPVYSYGYRLEQLPP